MVELFESGVVDRCVMVRERMNVILSGMYEGANEMLRSDASMREQLLAMANPQFASADGSCVGCARLGMAETQELMSQLGLEFDMGEAQVVSVVGQGGLRELVSRKPMPDTLESRVAPGVSEPLLYHGNFASDDPELMCMYAVKAAAEARGRDVVAELDAAHELHLDDGSYYPRVMVDEASGMSAEMRVWYYHDRGTHAIFGANPFSDDGRLSHGVSAYATSVGGGNGYEPVVRLEIAPDGTLCAPPSCTGEWISRDCDEVGIPVDTEYLVSRLPEEYLARNSFVCVEPVTFRGVDACAEILRSPDGVYGDLLNVWDEFSYAQGMASPSEVDGLSAAFQQALAERDLAGDFVVSVHAPGIGHEASRQMSAMHELDGYARAGTVAVDDMCLC
jgi:hypothetical protein